LRKATPGDGVSAKTKGDESRMREYRRSPNPRVASFDCFVPESCLGGDEVAPEFGGILHLSRKQRGLAAPASKVGISDRKGDRT